MSRSTREKRCGGALRQRHAQHRECHEQRLFKHGQNLSLPLGSTVFVLSSLSQTALPKVAHQKAEADEIRLGKEVVPISTDVLDLNAKNVRQAFLHSRFQDDAEGRCHIAFSSASFRFTLTRPFTSGLDSMKTTLSVFFMTICQALDTCWPELCIAEKYSFLFTSLLASNSAEKKS